MLKTDVVRNRTKVMVLVAGLACGAAAIKADGPGHSFTALSSPFTQELYGVTASPVVVNGADGFIGGVAFAPDGDVWAAECYGSQYHRFDRQGRVADGHGGAVRPESLVDLSTYAPVPTGCGVVNHPTSYMGFNAVFANTDSGLWPINAETGEPILGGPLNSASVNAGTGRGIDLDPASQPTMNVVYTGAISGFNFTAPGGGTGYKVTFNADTCSCPNAGNPVPTTSNDITTGPFAGFKGIITPYTLTVTARSTGGGSEVRLRREVQTVAVPVFQFGVFGERSLSFHAGANFNVTLATGETLTFRTAGAGSATTGTNKAITLVSTTNLAWATRVLWAGSGRSPITCTGYDATTNQLNGCYWATAPANNSVLTTNVLSNAGQSLLDGLIKIERQNANNTWTDVTTEILNLGFSAPNQEGAICADPTPNAVIRLQRLRDNGANAPCNHGTSLMPTDFWPNVLYDAREGSQRDEAPTAAMKMGGVMNYVSIDVGNLKRWLLGQIGTTGTLALNNNGFIVYFSDRRGNHNDADPTTPMIETAELGNEDSVNSWAGAAAQTPNGGMPEGGEDRNEDNNLQIYGALPSAVAGVIPANAPITAGAAFGTTTTPLSVVTNPGWARVNRQVLFRRALKQVNGCIGMASATPGCTAANGVNNLPDAGLSIAAENGVYVQCNYNAISTDANAEPNRPASILGDAIVILSNTWADVKSLNDPSDMAARDATDTGYRFAMVAGKSVAFTNIAAQ